MTTGPESPVRDAALDAAWRAHSQAEPPAHLDAAILAAAHDAVATKARDVRQGSPRAKSHQRWWMPLAAAAMISAVVIGVSRLASQDPAATAPYEADLPPRDNRILLEGQVLSPRAPEVGAAVKRIGAAPMPVLAAPPGPPPAPAPSVAFAPSPAGSGPTTALGALAPGEIAAFESSPADPSLEAGSTFAPAPQSAPRAGASRAHADVTEANSNALGVTTPDADAWMAHIRALYDEGKLAEAEKELVALRAAVPDADRRLPPDLQAWAKTVEPR